MKKVLLITAVLLILSLSALSCSSTKTTTIPAPSGSAAANTTTATAVTQTSTSAPATVPKKGGILRVLDMRLPTGSLGYPAKIMGQDAFFVLAAVETLFRIDANGVTQPHLATSWSVAPDRSSMTIKLQQGVKFHDGTDFNADAAKWNLEQVMAGKLPGTTAWTSIDKVDDYTVRINISQWENLIYSNLASRSGMMVSPTAIQKNGVDWANTNISATGPFKLSRFQRDTVLEFVRNDNYWQTGKPYLDGIRYNCIPDSMTQLSTFKVGDADLLQPWNAQVLSQLKGIPGTVFKYRHSGAFVLYPDTANPDSPFSKADVRMAVEYAIDKENLVKVSGAGIFEAAYQNASQSTVGYLNDIQPRKYDLNKAKELLTRAGYPNGFDCTLTITIPAPDIKDAQVALQTMLAKVGIKCNLEYADSAKYADYMVKGWKNTIIYSPANVEGNYTASVQSYYTIPNYYVSLKGPDSMKALYNAALTSAQVEPAKVQALARAMWDYCDLIPVTYMGTGQVYYDYLKDAGFLTFAAQMNWAPENAWFSK